MKLTKIFSASINWDRKYWSQSLPCSHSIPGFQLISVYHLTLFPLTQGGTSSLPAILKKPTRSWSSSKYTSLPDKYTKMPLGAHKPLQFESLPLKAFLIQKDQTKHCFVKYIQLLSSFRFMRVEDRFTEQLKNLNTVVAIANTIQFTRGCTHSIPLLATTFDG